MQINKLDSSLSKREGGAEALLPLKLIDLDGDGFHLLVEVLVYNQNFFAVLDTGASKSAFDKEIIESLSEDMVHHLPNQHAVGLGTTTMERYLAILPELMLGALKLTAFEIPVFDLSAINYAYEKLDLPPVIGVIGGDILREYHAIIDYQALTLKLYF